MRCRRIAVFLLSLSTALSLLAASCWDRREIDELALVSTVAVDRERDKTIVTAEFFRPAALSQQTGSGAGVTATGRQSHLATGSGPTIFRAIEDMGVKLPRELRWAHANNILVGEEMARRGLRELLDFWDRDPEARRSTHILLTSGPAKEVMRRAQSAFELDLGREIAGLEQAAPQTGYGFIPTVHTVIEDLTGESKATFLPILVLTPSNTPPPTTGTGNGGREGAPKPVQPPVVLTARLYGTGLFLKDRLVAKLNPRETRGLIWVLGDVREAVITVTLPPGKQKVDIEVTRVKPRVQVRLGPQGLRGLIQVWGEGNVAEEQGEVNPVGGRQATYLKARAAAAIRNEVTAALKRAKGAGTDVFGFAGALHRRYPRKWHELKARWSEEFKHLPVEVYVSFKLRRTGLAGPGLKI